MATITGPTEVIGGRLPGDYPHGQPMQWQTYQIDQVRQPLLRRWVLKLNEAWSDYRFDHPPEIIYYRGD
jgi:hypothetical protein